MLLSPFLPLKPLKNTAFFVAELNHCQLPDASETTLKSHVPSEPFRPSHENNGSPKCARSKANETKSEWRRLCANEMNLRQKSEREGFED